MGGPNAEVKVFSGLLVDYGSVFLDVCACVCVYVWVLYVDSAGRCCRGRGFGSRGGGVFFGICRHTWFVVYMCVCICIYVYICVCMCVYVCVCIYMMNRVCGWVLGDVFPPRDSGSRPRRRRLALSMCDIHMYTHTCVHASGGADL